MHFQLTSSLGELATTLQLHLAGVENTYTIENENGSALYGGFCSTEASLAALTENPHFSNVRTLSSSVDWEDQWQQRSSCYSPANSNTISSTPSLSAHLEHSDTPPLGIEMRDRALNAFSVVIENERIIMPSGGGFGDGSHPTTLYCAEALSNAQDMLAPIAELKTLPPVIDLGCGSGLLLMLARKKGFQNAVGVEIDKEALEHAKKACSLNGINQKIIYSDIHTAYKDLFKPLIGSLNELPSAPLNESLSKSISEPLGESLSEPLGESLSGPLNELPSEPLYGSFEAPHKDTQLAELGNSNGACSKKARQDASTFVSREVKLNETCPSTIQANTPEKPFRTSSKKFPRKPSGKLLGQSFGKELKASQHILICNMTYGEQKQALQHISFAPSYLISSGILIEQKEEYITWVEQLFPLQCTRCVHFSPWIGLVFEQTTIQSTI